MQALASVLAPKVPSPKPAAFADIEVPTAEEGRPIPFVFGEVVVRGPNVIWNGDFRVSPIRKKGGKK